MLPSKSQDGHAVDAMLNHLTSGVLQCRCILSQETKQDLVLMLNTQFRKSLYDFGEKWIGDFRNDQSKNTTAAGNKGSRMSVWVVAYLLNHPPHSSGKDRIHRGDAVDRSRNSRGRNLCPLRNFL